MPGHRCRGVADMAGQPMRLHHLPRGLEAQRVFGTPHFFYDLPIIPFLVFRHEWPEPETQKRAEARR